MDVNDFRSLDPAHGYSVASWGFERLLYSGLLDYDAGKRLIPHAATRWSVSPDGTTYTFYLRHDLHFEGPVTRNRLLTSADFAYEIRRVLDPKVASQGFAFFNTIVGADAFVKGKVKTIAGMTTPDPFTLVLRLSKPNPAFLNIMAMPFAFAVPREVIQKYGEPGFELHAEGSGPFTLHTWRRNVDILLDRNPHYWESGLPYLDHIHERFGIDPLNSMMMLETGEVGLIRDIPTPDFVRITHNSRFAPFIEKQLDMGVYYVSLNCEMPPLDRVKVRQAINYAIDRKRILQLINNRGILAQGVLPPGMPGYDPHLRGYPYDPAKARSLLAEAGLPRDAASTIWVRGAGGASEEEREAQVIQQDLKAVGMDVTIKEVAFPVWEDAVSKERTVPMSINDWYEDFPDPSDFLDVLLNSRQARPSDGNNASFYKSPQMDALLNAAAAEINPAKRLELYRRADQLAVHDAPWVFLYYPVRYALTAPYVHGFRLHPVWPALYEKIWLSG